MIIDAVIPLLLKHGADVTSKQIAEAAGIAEGTDLPRVRRQGDPDPGGGRQIPRLRRRCAAR